MKMKNGGLRRPIRLPFCKAGGQPGQWKGVWVRSGNGLCACSVMLMAFWQGTVWLGRGAGTSILSHTLARLSSSSGAPQRPPL